ncbi:MAG TPA: hypothetical protein VFN91_08985 [Myxococcaceae bacterium]|nr:hypothetical protein [Myxococcaceae bacterium]
MSTWKQLARVVSLFVLAVAPVAFADDSEGVSSDVPAPAARPASVDVPSGDDQEAIQLLQLEVEKLRAEVAANSADEREYLDQNLRPWR